MTSAEESSTQVEVAFTAALDSEELLELADARATAALRAALASGDRLQVHAQCPDEVGQLPFASHE